MDTVVPETNNLNDELVSELELSVIIYKLSSKVRVELMNDNFIDYVQRQEYGLINEYGITEVHLTELPDFYQKLRSLYKRYILDGDVQV